jgi:hypothetical protein
MYSHQLSISRGLPRRRRETANVPPQGNFFRGFSCAIGFSIPLWAAIIWVAYELFH